MALVAMTSTSGCSFLFVEPSVRQPILSPATCTDHVIWPVMDVALAAVATGAMVSFANREDDGTRGFADARENQIVGAGVTGLFFVGSAVTGFHRVRDCRVAKQPPSVAAPPQ